MDFEFPVKRVFFDSGMVLVHPRSGHWFATEAFKAACAALGAPWEEVLAGPTAEVAQVYLDENHLIRTEDEELALFSDYYRILLAPFAPGDLEAVVDTCARAKVKDYAKYAFYPDVGEAVPRLAARFSLGIISDAWPSVLSVYEAAGLRRWFDPFVVSSIHGSVKAEGTLFEIALSGIAEAPEECLFVDDSPKNCELAAYYGLNPVLFLRGSPAPNRSSQFPQARTLAELEALLQ